MNKRWAVKDDADEEEINSLAAALNIDAVLSKLLVQRGIKTYDEARLFFRPDERHLHDPFLMADMEKAVLRIEKAIQSGEKILVYGDYDVDGTTAVSVVYGFFKGHYFDSYPDSLEYYIPDRYKEGYGISTLSIDYASANGFTLIIALDCGIKSVDKIAYANTKGVDFIICDHHLPGAELPAAVAVPIPSAKIANTLLKSCRVVVLALS